VGVTTSPPLVSRLPTQCGILNISQHLCTSASCYEHRFTSPSVDDIRTSLAACVWPPWPLSPGPHCRNIKSLVDTTVRGTYVGGHWLLHSSTADLTTYVAIHAFCTLVWAQPYEDSFTYIYIYIYIYKMFLPHKKYAHGHPRPDMSTAYLFPFLER
jgi:hypothetical protein